MKTAILISGQMRSFAKCYPTQRWLVYRHYKDPSFFVSCCDDAQADAAELLRNDFEHVHIERLKDPDDLPVIPDEAGAHAPYGNAAPHRNLMLQHWGNQRVWEFFDQTENILEFHAVIRMRPDNFFHSFRPPKSVGRFQAMVPWWGRFGGCNDRFAVMGISAAFQYFNTYSVIPSLMEMGCPFHPESLVRSAMESNGIEVFDRLRAEFSTLRIDGSRRLPEIMPGDFADISL